MAAATSIFIVNWSDPDARGKGASAILVFTIWTSLPFLFGYILWKNFPVLGMPSIKKKYESLYVGLNTDSIPAVLQPIVFSIRRSVFVAITFLLFETPAL